jgi:hypothetical protein
MGGLIGIAIGLALGCFGFLVMRNPIRLAVLAPGAKGYYQRIVLDRWQRIPLRIVGAAVSLFGWVIFTAALGGLPRFLLLRGISNGLLAALWLVFIGGWVFGLVSVVINWAQLLSTRPSLPQCSANPECLLSGSLSL